MARIYKAFQVKIDKENKVSVPTGQKPPPQPSSDDEDDEDAGGGGSGSGAGNLHGGIGVFHEVPPEKLAGSGDRVKIEPGAAQTKPAGQTVSGQPGATQALRPEGQLSRAASAAREGSGSSAAKRKALELAALELRLRDWETVLVQREGSLNKEEDNLHNEMMARRKALAEESQKMLEMARKSSETIMSTAKAEADTLRKASALEMETARQKAHKEGFALGEEKGVAAGEKSGLEEIRLDWQSLMQETELLISELQTSRMGLLKAAEEEMVKLVITFAKRILKTEPLVRPEIILNNIDVALNKVSEVDKIVLRINMKDKSMTDSHKQDFMRRLSTVADLKVVEDSTLAPGGVKIETGVGTIDASLESQADEFEKQMLKFFNRPE